MAVTAANIEEIGEGTLAWVVRNRKAVLELTRNFELRTTDRADHYLEVLIGFVEATGITLFGPYDGVTEALVTLFCRGIYPTRNGAQDPYGWKVRVEYSSDVEVTLTGNAEGAASGSPASGGDLTADPLKRPAVVTYDSRSRPTPFVTDYGDPQRAVMLPNGEQPDPPLEDDEQNQVIIIERNVRVFDSDKAWQYQGAVNRIAWQGRPARAARLMRWVASQQEEHGFVFYRERYEIEVQYPNWDRVILNEGTYALADTVNRTKLEQIGGHGGTIGKVMLKEDGTKLPSTAVALAIAAGRQTVQPADMDGIEVGDELLVDVGDDMEQVTVLTVTGTTFTAVFQAAHAANCTVTGVPTYSRFKRRQVNFHDLKLPPV